MKDRKLIIVIVLMLITIICLTAFQNKRDKPLSYSRLEMPKRDCQNDLYTYFSIEDKDTVITYSAEFNRKLNHTLWVAYRFDKKTSEKRVTRTGNNFLDDINLGSVRFDRGYDRGHLCASADRLYSVQANKNTFYLSNVSPQMQSFNRRVWIEFEKKVQEWGRDRNFCDTLYVCKGANLKERGLGFTEKGMFIPMHYFMVLVKVKNNKYSGMAFYVPHIRWSEKFKIKDYVYSIREVEEMTGINFFEGLGENNKVELENKMW